MKWDLRPYIRKMVMKFILLSMDLLKMIKLQNNQIGNIFYINIFIIYQIY